MYKLEHDARHKAPKASSLKQAVQRERARIFFKLANHTYIITHENKSPNLYL